MNCWCLQIFTHDSSALVEDNWLACPLSRERRAESRESRGGSRSRGSHSVDRVVADNCQREAATRVGREQVKRSVREEVKPRGRRVPRLEGGYPPSGVGLLWPWSLCTWPSQWLKSWTSAKSCFYLAKIIWRQPLVVLFVFYADLLLCKICAVGNIQSPEYCFCLFLLHLSVFCMSCFQNDSVVVRVWYYDCEKIENVAWGGWIYIFSFFWMDDGWIFSGKWS